MKLFIFILIFLVNFSLFSKETEKLKPRIGLLSFKVSNKKDIDLVTLFASRVETLLLKTEKFQIVERKHIDSILNEQIFQLSGCVDSICSVKIGQLLAADYIISGSAYRINKSLAITINMVKIDNAQLIMAETILLKEDNDSLNSVSNFLVLSIIKALKEPYLSGKKKWDKKDLTALFLNFLLPGSGHYYLDDENKKGPFYFIFFTGSFLNYFKVKSKQKISENDWDKDMTKNTFVYYLSLNQKINEKFLDSNEFKFLAFYTLTENQSQRKYKLKEPEKSAIFFLLISYLLPLWDITFLEIGLDLEKINSSKLNQTQFDSSFHINYKFQF